MESVRVILFEIVKDRLEQNIYTSCIYTYMKEKYTELAGFRYYSMFRDMDEAFAFVFLLWRMFYSPTF